MVKGYGMSLVTRKRELKNLIVHAEEHGFNKILIADYRKQLSEIEGELDKIKEERERFKLNKALKGGNL